MTVLFIHKIFFVHMLSDMSSISTFGLNVFG